MDHHDSMLRDIENDSPIEANQIIGDMMRRASSFSLPAPDTLDGSRALEVVRTSPLAEHLGMRPTR
ncbi:ketopantoate reductase C-terminal domain-containing protein [Mesorhizobium sp. IMUNJ 23232]|uniref:ketopantoate reductase C-terminal domain-containing protein n=1 Tax=Mesorhizobium sp. IMUNJ 23232 TaxID=3376064 RepID=UPI0037A94802